MRFMFVTGLVRFLGNYKRAIWILYLYFFQPCFGCIINFVNRRNFIISISALIQWLFFFISNTFSHIKTIRIGYIFPVLTECLFGLINFLLYGYYLCHYDKVMTLFDDLSKANLCDNRLSKSGDDRALFITIQRFLG